MKRLALLLVLALPAGPATAEDVHIIGHASIIDGETLDVGPIRIRLNAIDAPEIGQACRRSGGGEWDCATGCRGITSSRLPDQGQHQRRERRAHLPHALVGQL